MGWLLVFWPGVLGEDSAATLMEVDQPDVFRSGKSIVWYYFVRLTYGVTHRVEAPIAVLMLLSAFLFARMLAWYWSQQWRWLTLFLLALICIAPHMVYFLGTLYPDAIFAVAATALLFEVWLMCRQRRATWLSLCVVALALPFAAFVRPNGIVFLVPAVLALWCVQGKGRYVLAAIIAVWCTLVYTGTTVHRSSTQSATLPLVLFETSKLLAPRAMTDFWNQVPEMNDPWVRRDPLVSPRTLEILSNHSTLASIRAYSDPAYWDMLAFHPSGPKLGLIPESERQELIHEFFHYNLWHNLPEVLASRLNVFSASALAEGGFPALDYSRHVLPRTQSQSQMRLYDLKQTEQHLKQLHKASYQWRWLLWTPWLGFALLALGLVRGWQRKNMALLLVCLPAVLQLGAIFAFSSAGEYRYLLPFFTLPLALFPGLLSPTVDAKGTPANAAQ